MRATAQDRDASAMMGINVNRTISFTFALAGSLAGAAGLLYALYLADVQLRAGLPARALIAFTAAVFGGIGNLTGPSSAGSLLGLIQSFNKGFRRRSAGRPRSSSRS